MVKPIFNLSENQITLMIVQLGRCNYCSLLAGAPTFWEIIGIIHITVTPRYRIDRFFTLSQGDVTLRG